LDLRNRPHDYAKTQFWEPVNAFFSELRHRGVCAVAIAHKGKDPKSGTRGSSAQEDVNDTGIELDRIGDPEPGRSTVRLRVTKSRLTTDTPPIEFALVGDGDEMSVEMLSAQEGTRARWERYIREQVNTGVPIARAIKSVQAQVPRTQKDSFYRAVRAVRAEAAPLHTGEVIPLRSGHRVRLR
jgi:hypothetical protein